MKATPFITIFTPAYNRAHTLPRTYRSLCTQSNKNFIWLIIDDGSTDTTKSLVDNWINEQTEFEIKYIYKENGGMHTAHNTAYRNITTELNVCIDSDDMLSNNAVQSIWDKWNSVKYNKICAGIIGLDADFNGNLIGKDLSATGEFTTLSDYYANGGTGDKKLVYKTEIIKQYPDYPVFENEKYVALAYKYKLIDQDYKLATLNEVLCNVEYQQDGSSATMWNQYLKNPKGFAFWRKLCMLYPTSKKRLIIDCIHYISSCIIANNKNMIKESPKKLMTLICIIPGIILSKITIKKARKII